MKISNILTKQVHAGAGGPLRFSHQLLHQPRLQVEQGAGHVGLRGCDARVGFDFASAATLRGVLLRPMGLKANAHCVEACASGPRWCSLLSLVRFDHGLGLLHGLVLQRRSLTQASLDGRGQKVQIIRVDPLSQILQDVLCVFWLQPEGRGRERKGP